LKTKINGKYLDPMVPAIAYQLANGARSVWAPVYKMQPVCKGNKHHGLWGSAK